MRRFVSTVLVVMVAIASGAVAEGASLKNSKIDKYCRLEKWRNPLISQEDLLVLIMLNSAEHISVFPDIDQLSGSYEFSAKEKDAFAAECLQGTNAIIRSEVIRSKIRGVAARAIPENSAVAMARLGLEDEYNRRFSVSYRVVSDDGRLEIDSYRGEKSFVLSLSLEPVCCRGDRSAMVGDKLSEGEYVKNCVIMLRGENYFRVIESDAGTSVVIAYFQSGKVHVKVMFSSGSAMSDLPDNVRLLCFIPRIGVYGVDLHVVASDEKDGPRVGAY